MSTEYETHETELEQRLRREAAAWGGAPSAACSQRWRAALEEPAGAAPRRTWLAAAAAVLLAGFVVWAIARGSGQGRPAPEPPPRDVAWWDTTVGPLEREYAALRHDARAVADAMWQGMPRPLRTLFGG